MRRTLWPYLALAAVLLAGCSGDPEPKEPDSTTSPSPTTTPPPLPEAATQETAEGAASFLQHFVDLLNHASLTGSVEGLRRISAETCTSCSKLVAAIDDVYAAGGKYTDGAWSLGPITSIARGRVLQLTADVTASEGTIIPSTGAEAQKTPRDVTAITFELEFVGAAWRVRQFAGVAP